MRPTFASRNGIGAERLHVGEVARSEIRGQGSGLGLAVLSKYSLADRTDKDDVAILKCKEFPIKSSWHIVSPKGKKLSPIATIFKKHLSEQAKGWR